MDRNLISYKLFESFDELVAFTTHRQTFSDITSPRFTPSEGEGIKIEREELAKILGIEVLQLIFPRQTHSDFVVNVAEIIEKQWINSDSLVTNQTGVCLCIQTADCVPILFYDPVKRIVAAVHSGWRGTVKNIAGKTIQKLITLFQSSPSDIKVLIGPSIGPQSYEVGIEVVKAVEINIPNASKTLSPGFSGKHYFNLWEANRQILISNGISNENIEIFGECTFSDPKKYFSARRDGINTGRLVSGIMLLEDGNLNKYK